MLVWLFLVSCRVTLGLLWIQEQQRHEKRKRVKTPTGQKCYTTLTRKQRINTALWSVKCPLTFTPLFSPLPLLWPFANFGESQFVLFLAAVSSLPWSALPLCVGVGFFTTWLSACFPTTKFGPHGIWIERDMPMTNLAENDQVVHITGEWYSSPFPLGFFVLASILMCGWERHGDKDDNTTQKEMK